MSKFTIGIDTDNAAFHTDEMDDEPSRPNPHELYWALIGVAKRLVDNEFEGKIRDSNGNPVGMFEWDLED